MALLVVFLVGANIGLVQSVDNYFRYSGSTSGTITEYSGYDRYCHEVVAYTVADHRYTFSPDTCSLNPKVGKQVKVYYKPGNPSQATLHHKWWVFIVAGLVGLFDLIPLFGLLVLLDWGLARLLKRGKYSKNTGQKE